MAKIHIILQGKGGVGKSLIAATIAQFVASKGQTPLCIDTDPVNATFEGYKALNVHRLNIIEDDEINTRNFDALIEKISTTKSDVIIDNGAVSISVKVKSGDYAPYVSGTKYDKVSGETT